MVGTRSLSSGARFARPVGFAHPATSSRRSSQRRLNWKEDTGVDASSPKDLHYYEPTNGHGLKHDPFNAIIAPRPIGWISSRDTKGNVNLAPYSF
jgi:hypothetical protein